MIAPASTFPSVALYILQPQGLDIAVRAAKCFAVTAYIPEALPLPSELDFPRSRLRRYASLPALIRETRHAHRRHIFIAPTDVAAACAAPLLLPGAEAEEILIADHARRFVVDVGPGDGYGPACCAPPGRFAPPSHFAEDVAAVLGVGFVGRTALSAGAAPVLEALIVERNMGRPDAAQLKLFQTLLVEAARRQASVGLYDPEDRLRLHSGRYAKLFQQVADAGSPDDPVSHAIIVTETMYPETAHRLVLHPKIVFVGVEPGAAEYAADLASLIRKALEARCLAPESLAGVATLSQERPDTLPEDAARILGVPLYVYEKEVLEPLPVTKPSSTTQAGFGLRGICEPAALAAAAGITVFDRAAEAHAQESPDVPETHRAGTRSGPKARCRPECRARCRARSRLQCRVQRQVDLRAVLVPAHGQDMLPLIAVAKALAVHSRSAGLLS